MTNEGRDMKVRWKVNRETMCPYYKRNKISALAYTYTLDRIVATYNTHTSAQNHEQQDRGQEGLKIIPSLNINNYEPCIPMTHPLQSTAKYNKGNPFERSRTRTGKRSQPCNLRLWKSVSRSNCIRHTEELPFRFKVLSYNMLAQDLLERHPYLYTGCLPLDLNWHIRASRLFEEITTYDPDIMCLQEVQASHMNSFYSQFEEIGYYGVFKKRTGGGPDGCAIYFKESLFAMQDYISVEFKQPDLPILNRDNIGIMVKLTPYTSPISIVVATTHLLYNPNRTDVRIAQMKVFLAEIDRFAYCNSEWKSGHLPIILTGDFNSTPDSVVLKLLGEGRINVSSFRDDSDWQRIGVTDNCQHLSVYLNRKDGCPIDSPNTKIYHSEFSTSPPLPFVDPITEMFQEMFNSDVVGHSLNLTSAYDLSPEESEGTAYRDGWITIDYIHFSRHSLLRQVGRLLMSTSDEHNLHRWLPNEDYPSDHLPLGAIFELLPSRL